MIMKYQFIVLFIFVGLFSVPGINGWTNLIQHYSKADQTRCFTCLANSKLGICADPFQAGDKADKQEECQSGWCMKTEFGNGQVKQTHDIGMGYIERKCMKYPMPDDLERCTYVNHTGSAAFVCFCKGDKCNRASTNLAATGCQVCLTLVLVAILL
jgi:hypothetical protein